MRVALRDASHYRTHRVTDGATVGHVPVWHAIDPGIPFISRCGRIIDTSTERDAEGVIGRCGRPGCKQAFAMQRKGENG